MRHKVGVGPFESNRSFRKDTGENLSDLTAVFGRVGGVNQYIMGQVPLFVQWPLEFFSLNYFALVPTPGLGNAVFAGLEVAVDENDGITVAVDAGFVEERRVPDEGGDGGIVGGILHELVAVGKDPGVEELFEFETISGVREDSPGDCGPIDAVIGFEDGVAPPGAQCLEDLRVGVGEADLVIGMDNEAAEFTEQVGDIGFAAADTASDSDDGRGGGHECKSQNEEKGMLADLRSAFCILTSAFSQAEWIQPVQSSFLRGLCRGGCSGRG